MANLQKIKELANEKNIAMQDLASRSGITPQALSRLMRLGSTNTDTLERISDILGVSPAVFFDPLPSVAETQEVEAPSVINGHHIKGNRVNDSRLLEKALTEIAEQRKLLATSQEHVSQLTAVVLNLSNAK